MIRKTLLILFCLIIISGYSFSQVTPELTRADTLRGSITPEREWWDLKFYHLDVNTVPADSCISGYVLIRYDVLKPNNRMQIDLQPRQ